MAKRNIPEISNVLNNRSEKTFIGRNEQLALFRQNFSVDLPFEDLKWIFNIHGQGGVGKTTLSKQYQSIAERQKVKVAFLDLEDNRLQNVPALLAEIVRQLSEKGVKFSEFDKKHKDFTDTIKELSKDENATPGLINAIVSGTIKMGVSELKKVPFTGIIDHLNTDGIADKLGNYSNLLLNRFKDKNKQELMTEPNKVLTTAFLEDIGNADDEVCIIFDTYETAFLNLDEWLLDIYQTKFGKIPQNIFVVISGRDELGEKWNEFTQIINKIPLEQFTEAEAIAFLQSKNITNEIIIKTLVEVSDRFPILLVLLSDNPPTSIEAINDVSGDAIERFLKWIKNPEEREVILAAALPRAINQDMVAELLSVLGINKTECQRYYDLLNKQPFVQQRGNIKTYHPVIKAQILKYRFNTSPRTWREQHYILANYFDAEAELLGFETLETKYTNDKWLQFTLEATYHKLCANFEKELPSAVEKMAIHLDRTRNAISLINWSQVIIEAGKLVGETKWSSFIQKGVNGFIINNAKISLVFFEEIIKQDWIKEPLASALFYGQIALLYSQEKKNIEKVIMNYGKALELSPNDITTYNNLGLVYYDEKEYEKAITNYKKVIELNPNSALTYNNLGNTYKADGDISEAILNYEETIRLDPRNEDWLMNLGITYFFNNDTSESLATFKKLIVVNPIHILAHTNIGFIYIQQKEYEKANESIQEAWQLSEQKNDFTAKNIAHLSLLQEGETVAFEKYKVAIPLWESLEKYLEQLESDYEHLKMEEKGISKVVYEWVLERLKGGS
jgi:tetratricopeptide (TPR) repeat protein